jgi:phosphatidate cytidylyltransferase
VLCLKEYTTILASLEIYPEGRLLMILSVLYLLLLPFQGFSPLLLSLPLMAIFATLFATFTSLILKNKLSITSAATTVLGMVWITIPLGIAYKVNYFFPPHAAEKGQYWLLFILFVTKMCDTAAYFVGSKLGKHPLAPSISPKKSIEGAIGGFFGAIATSYIFYHFSILSITLTEAIFLGVVLALLTALGDLAESILKRNAGLKDSSQLPGLGGFFDIMDSLLFTAPFVYFYLLLKWPMK